MKFEDEVKKRIEENGANAGLKTAADAFMMESLRSQYSYNFSFMGRPIIQYPQDMIAVQQIIWEVQPDLIIETGIAHGGSAVMSAAMLALLDISVTRDSALPPRKVVAVDIDIRDHNRAAIEAHPMAERIEMIQGSSISEEVVSQVADIASQYQTVMVFLDSNHTEEHVFAELKAYAPMTSKGSYCVVFDTIVEHMRHDSFEDRPWGRGDNPHTAVRRFLEKNHDFSVDYEIDNQLLVSVAPAGYLKKVAK